MPTVRGEREECYAITEEGAGTDVDAIEATARRDGDSWVLNGVKWHVTSFNTADYAFFQAKKIDPADDHRPPADRPPGIRPRLGPRRPAPPAQPVRLGVLARWNIGPVELRRWNIGAEPFCAGGTSGQ